VPVGRFSTTNQIRSSENSGKFPAANNVKSIPVKYSVESREYVQPLPGGFTAKVKISADITLQSLKSISFLELKNNELNIKASIKRENESAINKLLSDFNVGINTSTKEISFESQITINNGTPYQQIWSSKVTLDPVTGAPTYIVSIKYPEIKGRLGSQAYLASQYQVDIEITMNDKIDRGRQFRPIDNSVAAKDNSGWQYALAAGLAVGAVVIVVATVAEDIVTLGVGVGVADDAVSFAVAASLLGRAWTIIRMQQVAVKVGSGASVAVPTAAVAF